MTERPYVLAESTWKQVRTTQYSVAVLPWGATEAHNYHLPYATDNVQAEQVAIRAAERAWAKGARVVVLPTVPFGVNTTQLDIPLCLNMNPSTQLALLGDLAASLDGQGIHKLLILNGHGGNDFRQIVRELQPRTRVFLSVDQLVVVRRRDALHLGAGRPCRRGRDERDAPPRAESGPAARGGRRRPRESVASSWDSRGLGVGASTLDASHARTRASAILPSPRPKKGEAYVAAAVERIAEFLVELAAVSLDDLYA